MSATIMQTNDVERRAEVYLAQHCGVTRLLPKLWEMVVSEAAVLPGLDTPRTFARRYMDYLRDHTRASMLGSDG